MRCYDETRLLELHRDTNTCALKHSGVVMHSCRKITGYGIHIPTQGWTTLRYHQRSGSCVRITGNRDIRTGQGGQHGHVPKKSWCEVRATEATWCYRGYVAVCVGLARTVYIHHISPYIWWLPSQKYCIYTVYIGFWPPMRTSSPFMEPEVFA